jgi:hypothetical protein
MVTDLAIRNAAPNSTTPLVLGMSFPRPLERAVMTSALVIFLSLSEGGRENERREAKKGRLTSQRTGLRSPGGFTQRSFLILDPWVGSIGWDELLSRHRLFFYKGPLRDEKR